MNQKKDQLLKVARRGGFSDRNGIRPVNTEMQYTELDERSRIALANIITAMHEAVFKKFYDPDKEQAFLKRILVDLYLQQVDYSSSVSYDVSRIYRIVKQTILEDEYDNVLTVIEFLAQEYEQASYDGFNEKSIFPACEYFNGIFKTEYVGYRFINKKIIQITDENEIKAINEAAALKCNGVDEHFEKAILCISDRHNPDYENSIKESISAVEAMCSYILGEKATLGDALKHLKKKGVIIHPALEGAFGKLYGYTSDETGIRHAGQLGQMNSTFDEAKFMLVACSGFVNYLKGLCAEVYK